MLEKTLTEFTVSFVVFLAISLLLLILRKVLLATLGRWAKKTETRIDNIIVHSVSHPSLYWSIAIALYIVVGVSPLPEKATGYILQTIYILIILSTTIVAANMTAKLTEYYIDKAEVPIQATGLTITVIKGVILTIGGLILLNGLGVSITPLITALGVGGLAVALALQDTLSNLFAGIHILVEKPVRVGDYVKLDTGEEGYVFDVGWRTTRIRMLANNIIIIPNSKLAQTTITNYYYPEKRMSLLIPIGVSYDSDPSRVEDILVEEALKGAEVIQGLLKEPPPFVRFIPGFGDSSLNFTLICQVSEFVDQYLAQHELRKRILARFRKEGIEIPFPIRTVYLKGENADKDKQTGA